MVRAATDADNDTLSVSAVSSASTQGGNITFNGTTITYTPPSNYTGPDTFTYTLSDTFITVSGTVSVTVGGISSRITSLLPQSGGTMQLLASGLPGKTYAIQASTNLSDWTQIGTTVAADNGLVSFLDSQAGNYTNRAYRLAAP